MMKDIDTLTDSMVEIRSVPEGAVRTVPTDETSKAGVFAMDESIVFDSAVATLQLSASPVV